MDRLYRWLLERPEWVAIFVVLALVLLPLAVWLDLRRMSDQALKSQAESLNTILTQIRGYYATNVIGRIIAHPQETLPLHNYHDVPGAIPIPATLSIEIGEVIGKQAGNVGYRFVSDFVFANRVSHNLDAFERDALNTYRKNKKSTRLISQISGSIFDRKIRIVSPVIMAGACVGCHNSHIDSPKRDWRIGDIRGIQEITIAQPIARNIFSFTYLLFYLLSAGTIGLIFALLQQRQAFQIRQINAQLAQRNDSLNQVSQKISKYLSPQIYKSIFSGEKDASISTERKKLTIFFSDLKDFTSISDQLQPEELTGLLNDYFTQMSKIALAHGATIDKFVGDAMLAFFGDPHTHGTAKDARACLAMAIDMQRKLTELNKAWCQRGLERPLLARMGINTGICNVGNFGSTDRMDYTIIGAEANLAARLEQIAKPGGIVMSYETYALVRDFVQAKKLPPVTLKGISREVIPYAVEIKPAEKTTAEQSATPVFNELGRGLSIFVDVEALDDGEAKKAISTLNRILKALGSRKG